MKKLLALCMAFILTFQLVPPVFAEEPEETQTAAESVEVETEAPATETPETEAPATAPTAESTVPPAETEQTTDAATTPVTLEETEETLGAYSTEQISTYSVGGKNITCAQVTQAVNEYKQIINNWCSNNGASAAYWNGAIRHERGVSNPTQYFKDQADAGNYTVCLTKSGCSGSGGHSYNAGGCTSNEFIGVTRGGWQCHGFADYMAYVVFRETSANSRKKYRPQDGYDLSNYRFLPGDIVFYNKTTSSDQHFRFIYDTDNTYVYYVAGNDDGRCVIRFGKMTWAQAHNGYDSTRTLGGVFLSPATDTGKYRDEPTRPETKQVYLDINGYLDGRDTGYLEDYGTCDVYINGVKVADDCTDFCQAYPAGTTYSIEDIRATNGHQYIGEKKVWNQSGNTGVSFGTLSGTLTQNQEVVLEFKSLVYLDLNGYLDGRDFGSLENYGTCDVYIDGAKAADDCTDFYQAYPTGTTYSIEDIRATNGHQYIGEKADLRDEAGNTGVSFGSNLSGTLTKNQEVVLEFKTVSQGGKCGDNLTWALDGSGVLTISGSGDMWDFEQEGSNVAPWIGRKLTKLVLSDKITSIGNYAFYKCTDITGELTLPSNLKTIGKGAFEYCSGFSGKLVFPETLTEIKALAFDACSGFSGDLILPDGITAIQAFTFYKCEGLNGSLKLPKNLKTIDANAFLSCHNLTGKLELPETLTMLGGSAFGGCNFTGGLRIPGSVSIIGDNAFYHCQGFNGTLEITEGTTAILGYSFVSCIGFTKVILPESITKIGVASFRDMTGLQDVYYAGTAEQWKNINIESENSPLTSANIHCNENVASGACGDMLTWNLNSAGRLTISGTGAMLDYEWCQNGDAVYTSAPWGNLNVTSLVLEEGITRIGSCAFLDCTTIEGKLNLPSTLREIGDTAFSGCYGLYGTLNIPSGVKEIGECAFQGCDGLTGTLNLPKGLTYIGGATFNGCSGLTGTLVIPSNVLNIGDWAFRDCSGFTGKVVIPGKVAGIGEYAFAGCTGIEEVTIPLSVLTIETGAFSDCISITEVYYAGDRTLWNHISIGKENELLRNADIHFTGSEVLTNLEIRPVTTNTLTSGSKLTLSAWDSGKKAKVNWSLSEDSKAYASISSSGVLTAKTVSEVQNITVVATPTDGSLEARKEIQILPKITVKQAEKFNLFYGNGRAKLAIIGGQVASARFVEPSDFVLEDSDGQFYIRLAEGASVKPKTKVTLEITLPGCDTPVRQSLTIATTNAAPKLKLNPTASIVNTTLTESLTVETAILGTEDTLTVRSATKGVTASVDNGILTLTLDNGKTTTATVYLKGSDWAKEIRLTHRITVTGKKPTVRLAAKGKLDVLNPNSEIVYTPKLSNATGTITDVRLEGQDANLFNAEVVDGLVHLKLAKSGENYSTRKTYKVTPVVTLLGKDITAPTLRIKVTQSALKLAKLPNRTVYQSQTAPLAVKLTVTSPANAEIGDVQLNAKTTAALRNALEAAGGIQADEAAVSFPAKAFAALNPGRYTVILDVTPANAATDTKPIQARFTLTVQK